MHMQAALGPTAGVWLTRTGCAGWASRSLARSHPRPRKAAGQTTAATLALDAQHGSRAAAAAHGDGMPRRCSARGAPVSSDCGELAVASLDGCPSYTITLQSKPTEAIATVCSSTLLGLQGAGTQSTAGPLTPQQLATRWLLPALLLARA